MSGGPGLAVVTGASGGIGAAVARRLSAVGHPVLVMARRSRALAELGLDDVVVAGVDVREHDAVRAAVEEAVERYGPVQILVNNAGVMSLGNVATQDLDEWRTTFDVNLLASVALTRLVLSSMLGRGCGTVVFVSSIAARQVFGHHAAYCASKAATHALADATRLEAAPAGVRVVEVAPGYVATDLIASTSDGALRSDYRAQVDVALDPDAVAATVEWACSLPAEVCVREVHVAHARQP
ncbi:SDR family oxidoreductase [Nocardioides sp. LHD-245]|uniref:SDR family oxidoreductase n=1 Tax=Nocardioides sp. LHD-245 TaxID=3051387 RepID=UPI0027E112BA|nr:SDR family oxidoreductase [Nocardioides sp. LHD-245]